mgnify:CR=1 FL=1
MPVRSPELAVCALPDSEGMAFVVFLVDLQCVQDMGMVTYAVEGVLPDRQSLALLCFLCSCSGMGVVSC